MQQSLLTETADILHAESAWLVVADAQQTIRIVIDDGAPRECGMRPIDHSILTRSTDHATLETEHDDLGPDLAEAGLTETIFCQAGTTDTRTVVLVVADRSGSVRPFDHADTELLQTLAVHAGLALLNLDLVDRLRDEITTTEYHATHDALTGLPNRVLFKRQLEHALAAGDLPAVLLIDLDRFKDVNDTLGHQNGDRLLTEIGQRLQQHLGSAHTVARLGGDEFAAFLAGTPTRDAVSALAFQLADHLEQPVTIAGVEVDVGASIGVAFATDDFREADTLLRQADVAMYTAKADRSVVEEYSPARDNYSPQRLSLVGRLRTAIDNGDLILHYQPQIDLATGTVIGAEALARWPQPGRDPIPPDEFIHIAEHTGLIRPLTRLVLELAIAQAARWHRHGRNLRVSLNFSPHNLIEPGIVDAVAQTLDAHGLAPHHLMIELTETTVMANPARTMRVITELRDLGAGLAIDDFGTGHSSLSYLTTLPATELKIDKSFVLAMATEPAAHSVVRSIIDLGRNLNLDVIAEGVETESAAAALTKWAAPSPKAISTAVRSRPERSNVGTPTTTPNRHKPPHQRTPAYRPPTADQAPHTGPPVPRGRQTRGQGTAPACTYHRPPLNRQPVSADSLTMTPAPADTPPVALDALPSMPAAAVRIVGLCDDPDVEVAGLAAAVSLDPVLSARILRIANSAAYSRGNEVTAVDRAMMIMGIKVVKLTALGSVVSATLSDHLHGDHDIAGQVWRQCLVKAVACRELAHLAHLRSTPEAFLAGLFDGMGQLLGMVIRPEQFSELIAAQPFPDLDAEQRCLGMGTSELVRAALRSWGVPELYPRILEGSDAHAGGFDQSEIGRLAAVVVLARQATRQLLGHPANDETSGSARHALALPDDALDTIAVDLGTHVVALADSLGVNLGDEVDFPALLAHARTQMIETSMQIAEESMQQTTRITDLEDQRNELRRDSLTDRLTGIANRASFDDVLAAAIQDRLSGRTISGALGVAMIDIDHFKHVNDTYGHHVGDRVLAAVGAALAAGTRDGETIARYGGEEFVLVMPIVDSADMLAAAVERIRREIEGLQVDSDGLELGVTVSIGAVAASSILSPAAAGALTQAADRLLYHAKHAGRNTTRTDFLGTTHP